MTRTSPLVAETIDPATYIATLESRIASLERRAGRGGWRRTMVTIAAICAALAAGAALAELTTSHGLPLQQFMQFSAPHFTPPPLGTMVLWQRRDPPNLPQGDTNQILSLVQDASQKNSNSWPLYIQLSGTTDPGADISTSASVGSTVRAFNRSSGSPWLAGYHSEIYHGSTAIDALGGQQVETNGTSILYNGELISRSTHGRTIGLNLQNTIASTGSGVFAINIQSTSDATGWQNGIHFEDPAGGTAGNIGINFDAAHYNMGLDLADNSLRLNAGQKIYLEKTGAIYLSYNAKTQKVELVKSGQTVASW
jgi:hypothetical protein